MPIEIPAITPPGVEPLPEASFYIPATEPTTRLRRTMKQDDCFIVFDSHGDIGASPGGPDGLFYRDTRYLRASTPGILPWRPPAVQSIAPPILNSELIGANDARRRG
jgi:hypothetical protein